MRLRRLKPTHFDFVDKRAFLNDNVGMVSRFITGKHAHKVDHLRGKKWNVR